MSSPLSSAWNWSVEKSPLLNISRWILNRGYPNSQSRELIESAKLPSEIADLIDSTVKRTKLWRSERAEIARELITHTQDALESGRTPEQIIESFGNPKKVAKLLRRSAKRKRPLYWRTLRNMRRAITAVFALLFVVYTIQLVRYVSGKPNIKTNYAQIINSYNEAYSEDEKAWPIYNEVNIAWNAISTPVRDQQREEERAYNDNRANMSDDGSEPMSAGFFMIPQIPTDHPHYEQTAQLVRDFSNELDQLREACHRPIIGIDLGFETEIIPSDGNPYDTRMVPPNPNPDLQPTLVELLLPHLGSMRNFANLLYFDALVAARDGDHDRVYENLSAMLAMSRQQSFDGTIIADLVNIAIAHLTNGAMEQVLNEYPETLSREHLVALSHELTLVRPSLYMSFEGERMMFDDVLQRTYTDDGNGNGRLTLNGAQILTGLNGDFIDSDLIQANPLQILTGPVALTVAPDRRTQHTMFHSTMDLIERVQSDGPRLIALLQYHEDTLEANSGKIAGLLYTPVDLLLPALSRAVDRVFQAQLNHQASITMLALEIYRIDTGTYPNSLSELTPNYLPDLPADSFNPGHPLRYLPTDSGYKLYSVSSDADDDLGVPPEDSPRFPNFHDRFRGKYDAQRNLLLTDSGYPVLSDPTGPDGDWILIEIDRQQQ